MTKKKWSVFDRLKAREFVISMMQHLHELEELGVGGIDASCKGAVNDDGTYEISTQFSVFQFTKGDSPGVLRAFYRLKERHHLDIAMFEIWPGIFCTGMCVEIHGDIPRWETLKTVAFHLPEPWDE